MDHQCRIGLVVSDALKHTNRLFALIVEVGVSPLLLLPCTFLYYLLIARLLYLSEDGIGVAAFPEGIYSQVTILVG